MCISVPVCVFLPVPVQTLTSKGKSCASCSLSAYISRTICYKDEQAQRWWKGKKALNIPYTPAHTHANMLSPPGISVLFWAGWAELQRHKSNRPQALEALIFPNLTTVPKCLSFNLCMKANDNSFLIIKACTISPRTRKHKGQRILKIMDLEKRLWI